MRLFFTFLAALGLISCASCDPFPIYEKEVSPFYFRILQVFIYLINMNFNLQQVYGFLYEANATVCQQIRWNKLTTLVLVGLNSIEPYVINYAHNQNIRVQMQGKQLI